MTISRTWGAILPLLVIALGGAVYGQESLEKLERKLDVAIEPPEITRPAAASSGFLGITVDLMAADGKTVFIVSVAEGGPAAQGGLKADDQIVSVNGRPISSLEALGEAVRQAAGTKLDFKVRRAGVVQKFEVTMGDRPAAESAEPVVGELPAPRAGADDRSVVVEGSQPTLGISVADVNELTRRRFGVVVESGAVISQIREGTPAALAGLPLGGVIVSINGKRIGSANDIVELIRAFRPGEEIEVTYFEGDRIGRKKIRLGRTVVAITPAAPRASSADVAVDRTDPPLRLGRRRAGGGGRPILEALERTLDIVLPPTDAARPADASAVASPRPAPGSDATAPPAMEVEPPPPPPPPLSAPRVAAPKPASRGMAPPVPELPEPVVADELSVLRQQMEALQRQMLELQRKIDELEKKRNADK